MAWEVLPFAGSASSRGETVKAASVPSVLLTTGVVGATAAGAATATTGPDENTIGSLTAAPLAGVVAGRCGSATGCGRVSGSVAREGVSAVGGAASCRGTTGAGTAPATLPTTGTEGVSATGAVTAISTG